MLPDFGWSELLMIAIVMIVVIGPKDLPRVLRGFGKGLTNVRKMSDDFRKQMGEALKEAELDDLKQMANDVRGLDPRNQIRDAMRPLGKIGEDLNADIKKAAADIDAKPGAKPDTKPQSKAEAALAASGDKMRAAQPKAAAKSKPAAKSSAEPDTVGGTKAGAAKTAGKPEAGAKGEVTAAKKTPTGKTSATKAAPTKAAPAKTPAAKKPAANKKPAASKAATKPANKTGSTKS